MLKRLLPYFRDSRKALVGMYILSLIFAGTTVALPALSQIMVDDYILPGDTRGLLMISLVLLINLVVMYFSGRGQGILVSRISYTFLARLRQDLYKKIQKLPIPFFDTNKTGETISVVTNDVQVLEQLLQGGLAAVMVNLFSLVGIVIMMLLLDWRLSGVLVLTVPLFVLLVSVVKKRVLNVARKSQKELGHVNGFLNESISGLKVIRSFSKEEENIREFQEKNELYYKVARSFIPLNAFFWQSVTTINMLSQTLVLLLGGLLLWKGLTTIGIITAFMGYIVRFFQPIQQLSNLINEFSRGMASFERIFKIMDQPEEVYHPRGQVIPVPPKPEVMNFDQVYFRYKPEEPVLQGISFEARKGTTTAIVGHTGSGKSTMMNLLCRFYAPQEGRILLDDKEIHQMDLSGYRQLISIVMQEPILFSGSIIDNLRMGNTLTSEVIEEKMEALDLKDFIQSLPDGYESEAGARGNRLSLGERQLLSLGRALVKDPEILILDEATAYIDSLTEGMIQNALKKTEKNRFTFVIAHRLSTIMEADNILVIDQGRIVESGDHQKLLKSGGYYAELIQNQFHFE